MIGFSFNIGGSPPRSLTSAITYVQSLLLKKKSSTSPQGTWCFHCGGLKSWGLADFPLRPRNRVGKVVVLRWEKRLPPQPQPWILWDDWWLTLPQGPCQDSYLPAELHQPKEGIPAQTAIRDFIIIIFRYLRVNLLTPALLQLSEMTHWFIFFTFKLVFRTGFCPQVRNWL